MAQVTVRINGFAYTLACQDGEEQHLLDMAAEVDRRIDAGRATATVDQLGRTGDDPHPRVGQERGERRGPAGEELVVVVEEGEPLAPGLPDTPVPGRGESAVVLPDHPDHVVDQRRQHRRRVVGGAVVDHHDLPVQALRGGDGTAHGTAHLVRPVPGGEHHRQHRLGAPTRHRRVRRVGLRLGRSGHGLGRPAIGTPSPTPGRWDHHASKPVGRGRWG